MLHYVLTELEPRSTLCQMTLRWHKVGTALRLHCYLVEVNLDANAPYDVHYLTMLYHSVFPLQMDQTGNHMQVILLIQMFRFVKHLREGSAVCDLTFIFMLYWKRSQEFKRITGRTQETTKRTNESDAVVTHAPT